MTKELPCPHCGQDLHIPARYNAENIAQLEAENEALREWIGEDGLIEMALAQEETNV